MIGCQKPTDIMGSDLWLKIYTFLTDLLQKEKKKEEEEEQMVSGREYG